MRGVSNCYSWTARKVLFSMLRIKSLSPAFPNVCQSFVLLSLIIAEGLRSCLRLATDNDLLTNCHASTISSLVKNCIVRSTYHCFTNSFILAARHRTRRSRAATDRASKGGGSSIRFIDSCYGAPVCCKEAASLPRPPVGRGGHSFGGEAACR